MKIVELDGIEGVAASRGHVVLIDVLLSCTSEAYALAGGAAEVLLAGTIEEALALKRARPGSLLVGHGRRGEQHLFDAGDFPYELMRMDLAGRTLIHRTDSGIHGAVAAANADAAWLSSLVTATATARHLREILAGTVSLVAIGGVDAPESVACRGFIADRLRREEPRVTATRRLVRGCPAAAKLRDPAHGPGRFEDLVLALDVDRFGFAMAVHREGGVLAVRRVDVRVSPSVSTSLPFHLARIAARRRLDRIGSREDVTQVVDALIAADRFSIELCELVGRRGAPSGEDMDLLDRALAAAGVVVDTETAVLVETLAVVREVVAGRITPAAARAAIPGSWEFDLPPQMLALGPWDRIACADEVLHPGGEVGVILEEAREILRVHGPAFGLA